jgi:HD-GYP domain-containing protein (c-di-GMP phosphodiesterase class II)
MSLFRRRLHSSDSPDALAFISDLLAEFRSTPSKDQIASRILDISARLVPADALAVLLHAPDQQEAVILHGRGFWNSLAGQGFRLPEPTALRKTAVLEETILRRAFSARGHANPRVVFLQMKSRGRVVGSLVAARGNGQEADFSSRELRLLSTLADLSGGMILQAGLSEQVERQQSQIIAMRSVGRAISSSLDIKVTLSVFLDLVATQLAVDAAAVLILDSQSHDWTVAAMRGFRNPSRQYSHIRVEHSLASAASAERRTVSLVGSRPEDARLIGQPLMRAEKFIAYFAAPLIVHGRVKGVLEVFRRSPAAGDAEWLEQLESLALQSAIAIDNAESFENLQRTHSELTLACDSTIEGWSRTADLRAQEAEGHSLRVSDLSVRLAERLGVPPAQWISIRRGALLHDIGKIAVPDRILWKPNPLTDEEWSMMRRHPEFAEQLLTPIEFLRPAMDIPKYHHERWDGNGYPYGLGGEDIPVSARLFSVVDVWDSLLANRPFRKPWTAADTIRYLHQNAGTHFDPDAVEAFIPMIQGIGGEKPLPN